MAQQGIGMGSFFGNKKPVQQEDQAQIGEIVRDVTRRLRVMEERMTTDRKNILLNQQNILSSTKKVNNELKNINTEFSEIKKEIASINEQLTLVMNSLANTTKKDDVKVLEKYIELWEPLNFVTKREVETLIRRILNETNK
ncbi:MAG: hypothetical protein ABIG89_00980 [Candidatus Woesearchaeota archaeon]